MSNIKCVFVSAPFTGTPFEQEYREVVITRYIGHLMRKGIQAYSPVTFGCAVAFVSPLPVDYAFWEDHCKFFVDACTEVHVLMLDGWNQSNGVAGELREASKLGKIVHFIKPDFTEEINHGR